MNDLQIVERLEIITRLQAEVITELFGLLSQHIAADELDRLPCAQKYQRAAAVRDEVRPYIPRAPTALDETAEVSP